jgi:hypothetical protein
MLVQLLPGDLPALSFGDGWRGRLFPILEPAREGRVLFDAILLIELFDGLVPDNLIEGLLLIPTHFLF